MDLQNLMELVERHWPFDEENYPGLPGVSDRDVLKHILFHQIKAATKLTEVVESMDHGAPLDEKKLRQAIRNFLINTLRLADVADISAAELETEVKKWAAELHVP